MRPRFPLGILSVAVAAIGVFPQGSLPQLADILRAEDARAATPRALVVLRSGLASPDSRVRRAAIRAFGRLERSELAPELFPLLTHREAEVRAEAVQAVAQAVQDRRPSAQGSNAWSASLAALERRASEEADPAVLGMLALALGRLPYRSSAEQLRAQAQLLALEARVEGAADAPLARALETLTRAMARRTPPAPEYLDRLRALARSEAGVPVTRRAALAALVAAQAADSLTLRTAFRSSDTELRRLALDGISRLSGGALTELLRQGLADASVLVRYEALRGLARATGTAACGTLRSAAQDSVPMTALLALDLLGTTCRGDSLAAAVLAGVVATEAPAWQRSAHALVSLARLAPAAAAAALPAALAHPRWQPRMYAARAAAELADTAALRRLAEDPHPNVREAALGGLGQRTGHAADPHFRAALGAGDYQLVQTAAERLAGSPARREAAAALVQALRRITRDGKETSRDVRVALLVRLRELGDSSFASGVAPALADFDPVVAESAAAVLGAWTGRRPRAAPLPRQPVPLDYGALERLRDQWLRVTLASGGSFQVELLVDEAPLTVLRIAQLVAARYYDGLDFHRVVPNFVLQGGSPGANEYAGDGPFMRDEVGPLSHERGTLGISTRGRDTGDAQLFLNLVDNRRLDFAYTVWGRVVTGMEVVDAIQEGDVMRRVELVPRGRVARPGGAG